MPAHSYRFTHAVTRAPGASITQGLRDVDTGAPELARFQAHHAAYIAALRATGAQVSELPALDDFPDGVFVEVHPDPERALSDATTQLSPARAEALLASLAALRRVVLSPLVERNER